MPLGNKEKDSWHLVPKIFLFKHGEYYPYDGYFMRGMFLHFLNRVINPVVVLSSDAALK